MKNKRGDSFKYKSLRQRAEIVLSKTKKKKASIQPDVDIQELFHENELLKTELKLQYEDLKTAKMQVISFDKQLSDLRANTCQNIPSGFVCLSLDGNIDQLNDKAAKLFGRKKNELVSANIKQFITQDSLPVFNAFLTDLLKEEIQKNCEIWLTPPEGALHFVIMEGIISQDKLKYLITMIDISGKKNTGNTLLGNEERYRHLVELSPNGIAIYQEGHFVYVNPAGIKMLRAKDLQDLIGKPVLSIVHPESMDGVIKRIKLVSEGIPVPPMEEKLIRLDGSIFDAEVVSLGTTFHEKTASQVMIRDITERKLAETKLKESEAQFKDFFENAADAIFIADMESGIIIDANLAASELLQLPHNKIIGIHQSQLHPIQKNAYANETFTRHKNEINQKISTRPIENSVLRSDGTEVPIEILAAQVIIKGKKCVMGTFRDLSERKRAQEALKINEEKYQTLLNLAPDAFFQGDTNGNFITVNDKTIEVTGFSRSELLGMNMADLFPLTVIQNSPLRYDLLRLGQTIISEREIRQKNGAKILVEMNSKAMPDGTFQCFMRDITERKLAEENLVKLNLQLKELNATKDKLFSIFAHDLRGPFNSILGFLDLLRENIRIYDVDKTENFINLINSSAKYTFDLLEDILAWAKTQTGQIDFNPEKIQLIPIVNEVLDLFDSAAKIKNISIKYNPSNECTIYADQNMLQTILRNLTSNAIKYTNNGGCITIAHVLTASQVTISISDNGIGMTQEIINNLWEFTSKLSIRGTDGEKGTGLGLILCKEFIDKHKGEIWVKSEPGNGSTFSFTLPLIN